MTETEKLDAAMRAVMHVLGRICEDPKVSYLLGDCTQSYVLLCTAVASYNGRSLEDVQMEFTPARQLGTPTRAEVDGVKTLTALQRQVCGALNVAPFVAAQIIRHAERRGRAIQPFYLCDGDEGKQAFLAAVDGAYTAWCDRCLRRLSNHA